MTSKAKIQPIQQLMLKALEEMEEIDPALYEQPYREITIDRAAVSSGTVCVLVKPDGSFERISQERLWAFKANQARG